MTKYESLCSTFESTRELYNLALVGFKSVFAEKLTGFLGCNPEAFTLTFDRPSRVDGLISCKFELSILINQRQSQIRMKGLNFATDDSASGFSVNFEKEFFCLDKEEEAAALFERLFGKILNACQGF